MPYILTLQEPDTDPTEGNGNITAVFAAGAITDVTADNQATLLASATIYQDADLTEARADLGAIQTAYNNVVADLVPVVVTVTLPSGHALTP